MKNISIKFYITLTAIVITAFLMIWFITPYGAGVSPDSIAYISAAKSLLAGKGYSISGEPVVIYPPLYSIFLAVTGFFEKDLVKAARFLNIILFAVNTGLVFLAAYLTAGRRLLIGIFAGALFLSSAEIIEIHAWAWSEPLFIMFSLICIILLSLYLIKPFKLSLIVSALSAGFAVMTRYIGIAFLPAALIVLFMEKSRTLRQKFIDGSTWLLLAGLPLVIFMARNILVSESSAGRKLVSHFTPVNDYLAVMISEISYFIIPNSIPVWIVGKFVILIILALALFLALFKKYYNILNPHSKITLIICLIFISSYLFFLYIAESLFDSSIETDYRLLSPFFVILILGFSAILDILIKLKRVRLLLVFLILISVSFLIRIPKAVRAADAIKQNGLGYTSAEYKNSKDIAYAKSLPQGTRIYSNGPEVLDFLTENDNIPIPEKISPITTLKNPGYDSEMKVMCREIAEKKAVLIYFSRIDWRWYLPGQDEIKSICGL